jgi:hypothetical protein
MEFEVMRLNGKIYLTLLGFNQLREQIGLEKLRPMPGEAVLAFKERVRAARRDFFQKYPDLGLGFEEP